MQHAPAVSSEGGRTEVLNISNINSNGVIVLNDERLLTLIQEYPFLYHSHDVEIGKWAWHNITKDFNSSYNNSRFTSVQLQMRWKILKPIIRSLSKVYDLDAIPESLRKVIISICQHLDVSDQQNAAQKITNAQQIIHANIEMVEELPLKARKCLEAEMLQLLFNTELETECGTEISAQDLQRIEIECKEFLQRIHLKSLPFIKNNITNNSKSKCNASNNLPLVADSNGANDEDDVQIVEDNVELIDLSIEPVDPSALQTDWEELINKDVRDCNAELTAETDCTNNLLEPLPQKGWVPLADASLYVRSCVVRIKRVCLDDDLPLAIIKRERKWKS